MSCSASGFLSAADARLKSRNDKAIYGEICAVENQLLDAMCNCSGTAPLSTTVSGGTPVTSPKGITGITILLGGSGYVEDSPVVSDLSSTGTGLDANAVVDSSNGMIIGFTYTARGINYLVGDSIAVSHPSGSTGVDFEGTVASVGANGEVNGITISVAGDGYLDTPYVKIIDPVSGGSGFIATLVLDSSGTVTDIDIVNGGRGYSANATAIIVGTATTQSAILSTQTEASTYLDLNIDPTYYYKVWAGLVDDVAVKLQIDIIRKYFTDLGYNFIVQVNPSTMNTLQYQISW